jgi:predicted Zn-dependent peptidase/predicted Ser/Thr protein kinase
MGDCPERSRTVALGSGTLRSEEVSAARSHAASCPTCRLLLGEVGTAPTMRVTPSEVTQGTMTSPGAKPAPTDRVSRPWIGRYKIVEKLGAGGMGTVYAAEDAELDRKVAIKLLHGTSETASARLVREARALAKLRHPNVVTIYEVGRDDGDAFVAMELVEGTTLRDWLQQEHSIDECLAVLLQAGRGLVAAHAEGLIHRDFKPENVMVGDNGRVQVLDFGLAKTAIVDDEVPSRPSNEPIDSITQTGTLLGTPAYMAPEQFAGEDTDARTDQFAYCVTVFEVLHGHRPFQGATHAALHTAILERTFSPLPRRAIPAHVDAAVMRGLSVDPAARFPDMMALLAALEAKPVAKASRVRTALTLGSIVVVGGALGVALALDRGSSTTPPEKPVEAKPSPGIEPLQATPLAGDRMKVTQYKLSNGLTVWVSPNRKTPRIDARLVIRAGSRDSELGGVAHIVEHMASAGTSRLGTLDFGKERIHLDKIRQLYGVHATAGAAKDKVIAEIDAESVAASRYAIPWEIHDIQTILGIQRTVQNTDADTTQFGVDVPSNKFELWAKLEGERVSSPVFRGFHVESGVVFDEIYAQRSQSASVGMYDQLLAVLFANHPYVQAPSGTYADLVDEHYTAAEQFHATWYVPNNATLLLAGDVDPEQAIRVLDRELGRWKPKPLPSREPRPMSPISGERRRVIKGADLASAMIGWRAVPYGHPDDDGLLVLDQLIGQLARSYAGRTVIETFDQRMIEGGLFVITLTPVGGRSVEESIADVDELVRTLQTGAFSDELFEAVIRNYKLGLERSPDSNAERITRMAAAVAGDRGWQYELDRSKRVAALTKQDLVRIATRYLTRDRAVAIAEAGPYQMPSVKRPIISPLQPVPNGRSAFGKQLLAEEIVDLPPRFVDEGRDYQVGETAIGPLITVANTDDDTYAVRLVWNIGSRQLPLVCTAMHALDHAGTADADAGTLRARWYARAQTTYKACTSDQITVELSGIDSSFDTDWAEVERWLTGAGIDDAVWDRSSREYQTIRTYMRSAYLADALDSYVSYGPASAWLTAPATTTLARTTAAELRAVLQTLTGVRRTIAYYGPRSADAIKLPPGAALSKAQPTRMPVRLSSKPGTRIALFDTGSNRAVTATIRINLGSLDLEHAAVARVFASYLSNPVIKNAFTSQRGIAFSGFALLDEQPKGDDSSLKIQFSTTAEHIVDALEIALASARDPGVESTHAAQAVRRIEEMYRGNWIAPRDLPSSVLSWRLTGYPYDPRSSTFNTTRRTKAADLGKFAAELARASTYISLSGDVSKLDRAKLAKLGTVEVATPAQLFAP